MAVVPLIGGSVGAERTGASSVPAVEPTTVNPHPSPSGALCRDYFFPVTISPEATSHYKVFGRLCANRATADDTLLVLLHGGSYNSTFWDWPVEPERYSFVKAATQAGFSTLNIDRLGYGHSDHPFSLPVDFQSNAWVTHQIARHLRRGAVGSFGKLVLAGHSMGGFTAVITAGTYPDDFDGLIVEDAAHNINWVTVSQVVGNFYPAEFDAKFRGRDYPPGFTTTRPNSRAEFLYYKPGSDADIWASDEEHKDTINAGEWATLAASAQTPAPADRIRIPVLMVFGDEDNFYCLAKCSDAGSAAQLEQRYFPQAACYDLYIQPRAGHSAGLHRSAPQLFNAVVDWAEHRFGNGASSPTAPCEAGPPTL
jgi:pimeloyl-ACP methyl ester carboxylesterase